MDTPTKTDLLPEYVDRFDYGDGYVRHIDAPAGIVGATRYYRTPTVNLAELRERVIAMKKRGNGIHNAALDAVIALIDGGK